MRVLVTGDREWGNAEVFGRQEAERQVQLLQRTLNILYTVAPDTILVAGGARGADSIAEVQWKDLVGGPRVQWEPNEPWQTEVHKADWTKYRKAAGPIRNQFMIDESVRRAAKDNHRLEKAIACHVDLSKSKGTKDMVDRLTKFFGRDNIMFLR